MSEREDVGQTGGPSESWSSPAVRSAERHPFFFSAQRRIYVASSWRCPVQPAVVGDLRAAGHKVYDFRNPRPGDNGFAWSEIDPDWLAWKPEPFRDALGHPVAVEGFLSDFAAMQWADTFVLVLPCGRSAHLEAGWAIGAGKPTAILLHQEKFEPELMYRMADLLAVDMEEVTEWLLTLSPFALVGATS